MKKLQLSRVATCLCIVVLVSLIFAPAVLAFEGREGDLVVVDAGEVIEDDLFVGAETFVLDGVVQGDLLVFASEIVINGVVEGDLIAGGQRIAINGELQDDAWVAGYAIELSSDARVGDDFRAAGYSLVAGDGVDIYGTLLYAGYQALLENYIGEHLMAGCFGLEIDGTVEGNVTAGVGPREQSFAWNPSMYSPELPHVPSIMGGLTLGPEARIGGDLDYTAADRIDVPEGVVDGHTTFTYDAPPESPDVDVAKGASAAFGGVLLTWIVNTVRRLVAVLLVGLLIAWLAPRWITAPAEKFKAKPWPSLGWGALVFFLFPPAVFVAFVVLAMVVAFLLLVTLGNLGGPIAIIGTAIIVVVIMVYILILTYLTKLAAGYIVGRLLFPKEEWAEQPILPTLVGVLFVVALTRIPVIGWLLGFAISLFGLGAIGLALADKWGKKATSEDVPVEAAVGEDLTEPE